MSHTHYTVDALSSMLIDRRVHLQRSECSPPSSWSLGLTEERNQQVITAITHDSRRALKGHLYVALKGRVTHGARFIESALRQGASAIALPVDTPPELFEALSRPEYSFVGIIWLDADFARQELAWLSAWIYGVSFTEEMSSSPSAPAPLDPLRLVGITGTNGKTTTTTLIADILELAEGDVGLIGTIENRGGGVKQTASMTTMEAPDLHAHYRALVDAGLKRCIMEVSSIGIEEERVNASRYHRAAFLNLSEDHLDYHGDMERYAAAKLRLFSELLTSDALSVICVDGPGRSPEVARRAINVAKGQGREVWRCAIHPEGLHEGDREVEVFWRQLKLTSRGISGTVVTPRGEVEITSPLMGRFNASNLAVAVAITLSLGIHPSIIRTALSTATVSGRMELVPPRSGLDQLDYPPVLVDYAHTPDALQNALSALRDHGEGRVWVLFGCGGDRDKQKRPLMGEVAAQAWGVVITSDNPRDEDPLQIIEDAAHGLRRVGMPQSERGPRRGHFWAEPDRATAITTLIQQLDSQDILLIAGKGHEPYQEGAHGKKIPFSDQEVAAIALDEWIRAASPLQDRLGSLHSATLCDDAGGNLRSGQHQPLHGVTIDTRKINTNAEGNSVAFFCLRGARDGHDFVGAALERGAGAIFVRRSWTPDLETQRALDEAETAIIEVDEPEHALAVCAVAHRKRVFKGILIGLTGSNGKTSTKDLLASALNEIGPTLATEGNHNNHLGVPLTLFRLRAHHHFAVIEMGMNAPGEIAQLAKWAQPDLGLITTIAAAHLEGLGSIEAVALAKGELVGSLEGKPTLIPEAIPAELRSIIKERYPQGTPVLLPLTASPFTTREDELMCWPSLELSELQLSLSGSSALVSIDSEVEGEIPSRLPLTLHLHGAHQLANARLALAAGIIAVEMFKLKNHHEAPPIPSHWSIPRPLDPTILSSLIGGLGKQKPSELRGQLLRYPRAEGDEGVIWLDCYNANPQSVLAALQTFIACDLEGALVIGSIGELGSESMTLHRELGHQIAAMISSQTQVLTIGEHAHALKAGLSEAGVSEGRLAHFTRDEIPALARKLQELAPDAIFIKGSRSARLERLIPHLNALPLSPHPTP